ncbi:hypothetical protein HGM15179_020235 [Zosterops borbonicus]|uniref:RNase H type-1 domain-containing protein n=1 Tax=Zosterops borbonicus TaxID=364589 RepID=A0A8K1FYI2_9PASS|nr:hypothetical protein HGM15179_020235 [Zosterops borbonicus]
MLVDMIEACSQIGTKEEKNVGLAEAIAMAVKPLVQHGKSVGLKCFCCGKVEELPWLSRQPVEGLTVFSDASRKNSKAGLTLQDNDKWLSEILEGPGDSLQVLELHAVIRVFEKWPNEPINIVSDSLYVVVCVNKSVYFKWSLFFRFVPNPISQREKRVDAQTTTLNLAKQKFDKCETATESLWIPQICERVPTMVRSARIRNGDSEYIWGIRTNRKSDKRWNQCLATKSYQPPKCSQAKPNDFGFAFGFQRFD